MKHLKEQQNNLHLFGNIKIFDLPKFTQDAKPKYYRSRYQYNAQVCAFDIETTALPEIEQSVMYIWQFAIEDYVIIGRTWEEFKTLVKWLNTLSFGRRTVVYVHNLSYEFQFLSGIFHFEDDCVFPMENRKVLKAVLGNLEFRCSYLLTNLGLSALTKRYQVEHQKLSGEEFDYSIRRFPDTTVHNLLRKYFIPENIETEALKTKDVYDYLSDLNKMYKNSGNNPSRQLNTTYAGLI